MPQVPKRWRTALPHPAPPHLGGWATAKEVLRTGKMPTTSMEPLGTLQGLADELCHSSLLDAAAASDDPAERLCNVAAFAVAMFANTAHRARKPFNPMMGETYQMDRMHDLGFTYLAEQVSHNPDISACEARGARGWHWQQVLRVPHISIGLSSLRTVAVDFPSPPSAVRLTLPQGGSDGTEVYSWTKITDVMRAVISRERFLTHVGRLCVSCSTGYRADIVLHEDVNAFDAKGLVRLVTGKLYARGERLPYAQLQGEWHGRLYRVPGNARVDPAALLRAGAQSIGAPPPAGRLLLAAAAVNAEDAATAFGFSWLAKQLNEFDEATAKRVAPTDSRHRPDQRHYENGDYDAALRTKRHMETMQRHRLVGQWSSVAPLWFEPVPPPADVKWARGQPANCQHSKPSRLAVPFDLANTWWQSTGDYWRRRADAFAGVKFPTLWPPQPPQPATDSGAPKQ